MSEKDYIISLLDKYLKYLEENENKNRSYFKDVLSQINDNYNYIYDFIIGISENLILELLDDIHYENKKDFLLDFNEIRNKLLSYNGDYTNLKLDDGENNTINLFKKLITDFVNVKDDDKDYGLDFKDRLDNNKSLLENDYDLLEKIIYLLKNIKKPPESSGGFRVFCRSDLVGEQDFEDLDSCRGDRRAGAEDGRCTCFVQCVVILVRNHAAYDYYDVFAAQLLQFADDLRYECLVTRSQ